MTEHRIYWSCDGESACESHAPPRNSEKWTREKWQEIPRNVLARAALTKTTQRMYACRECAETTARARLEAQKA